MVVVFFAAEASFFGGAFFTTGFSGESLAAAAGFETGALAGAFAAGVEAGLLAVVATAGLLAAAGVVFLGTGAGLTVFEAGDAVGGVALLTVELGAAPVVAVPASFSAASLFAFASARAAAGVIGFFLPSFDAAGFVGLAAGLVVGLVGGLVEELAGLEAVDTVFPAVLAPDDPAGFEAGETVFPAVPVPEEPRDLEADDTVFPAVPVAELTVAVADLIADDGTFVPGTIFFFFSPPVAP